MLLASRDWFIYHHDAMTLDLAPLDSLLDTARATSLLIPLMQHWQTLCELLASAPFDKRPSEWLERCERDLDAIWPDELRACPLEWLRRKKPPAALRLARHLALGEQSAAAHRAIFERLAASEEALSSITSLSIVRGQKVAGRAPVTDLLPDQSQTLVRALERAPLASLHLRGVSQVFWEELLASDVPSKLRELSLGIGDNDEIALDVELSRVERLISAPRSLRALSLGWGTWRKHDGYSDALIASILGHATTLESIVLTEPIARETQLEALVSAAWPALERVTYTSRLAAAPSSLARWIERAPRLVCAIVGSKRVTFSIDREKRSSGEGPALRELEFDVPSLDPEAIAAVLASPSCAGVRTLRVRGERCSPALVDAILRLPLESLSVLTIGRSNFEGAAVIEALVESPIPTVRALHVPCNSLDSVCKLRLPSLRALSVFCTRFDPEAFERLVNTSWLSQLDAPMELGLEYAQLAGTAYATLTEFRRYDRVVKVRF